MCQVLSTYTVLLIFPLPLGQQLFFLKNIGIISGDPSALNHLFSVVMTAENMKHAVSFQILKRIHKPLFLTLLFQLRTLQRECQACSNPHLISCPSYSDSQANHPSSQRRICFPEVACRHFSSHLTPSTQLKC